MQVQPLYSLDLACLLNILLVGHSLVVHGKEINGHGLLVCEARPIVIAVALTPIAQAFLRFSTYMVMDLH